MSRTNFADPLLSRESAAKLQSEAEKMLDSIGKAREGPEGELRCEALRYLSMLYLEQGELHLAEKRITKGLKISKMVFGEDSVEYRWMQNYLGVLYFKQDNKRGAGNKFKEIVSLLKKSRASKQSTEERELLTTAKRNYAGVLSSLGQHDEAAELLASLKPATNNDEDVAPSSKAAEESAVALATINRRKQRGKQNTQAKTEESKRTSLRKRLSLIIGSSSKGMDKKMDGPNGLEFFFDMPLGKSSLLASTTAKVLSVEETELMQIPIVELLDHISSMLADSRRNDHIELLFRTALSGSYGHITKLEEQRICMRLALLLSEIPEHIHETTKLLHRTLTITEELFGKDDIQTAVVCADLGTLYARKMDFATAEDFYRRSVKIFRTGEFPHQKEDTVCQNLAMITKSSSSSLSRDDLEELPLLIDDEWILCQSETDLSPAGLASTLASAITLERLEKDSPAWYNWRGNERKKALLAYALEVLRDNGTSWEIDTAPKYLGVVLFALQNLGLSVADVPTAHIDTSKYKNTGKVEKKQPRRGSAFSSSSLFRRKSEKSKTKNKGKPGKLAFTARKQTQKRFIDPDVDLSAMLSKFFAVYSPAKDDPSFIEKFLQRYKTRQMALIETLELKYNVTFKSDGTWVDNGATRAATLSRQDNRPDSSDDDSTGDDNDDDGEEEESKARSSDSSDRGRSNQAKASQKKEKRSLKKVLSKPLFSASSSSKDILERHTGPDVDESGTLDPEVSLRQTLHNFYLEFAPERVDAVDTMLTHFRGRHRALFTALQNKYGVQFLKNGRAVPLNRMR